MKEFLIVLLFLWGKVMAQDNPVAHFSFWKAKPGQEENFEKGYKEHLNWHKLNGDTWAWYGWFIISGVRDGQFVDVTFNHAWGDFDRSFKPAEDNADNQLHTEPFGDFIGRSKMVQIASLSISDSNSLKSKFLRLVTIQVTDLIAAKRVMEKLKNTWQVAGIKSFLTFKLVDGGDLNQLVLLIGLNTFEEYNRFENLQEELSSIEMALKIKTINSITSETLVYRADMSLFPK